MEFNFFLREAASSLRRNWVITMAAILTVLISMLIFGVAMIFDRWLNQGATSLKDRVLITIDISNKATPDQRDALRKLISANSEIRDVKFVSKEESLKRVEKTFGSDGPFIIESLTSNPLPDSYEVKVRDTNKVEEVAATFIGNPAVDDLVQNSGKHDSVRYARKAIRRMLGTLDLVEKVMWVAMVLFTIAAVLLISITVRLSIFARRREIEIMRLVGATNWFIRWPFVFEGFITGFVGSLLAGIMVWGGVVVLKNWVNSTIHFVSAKSYPAWFQSGGWPLGLLPTLMFIGAALGAIGGGAALRRYLKV